MDDNGFVLDPKQTSPARDTGVSIYRKSIPINFESSRLGRSTALYRWSMILHSLI
jgi:hypothetical protein